MPAKDFYCIEVEPYIDGSFIQFNIFLTKRSLVKKTYNQHGRVSKKGSIVVTSPELKYFLFQKEEGIGLREKIDSQKGRIQTGSIKANIVNLPGKEKRSHYFLYMRFFPFELYEIAGNKRVNFEDAFRGMRLGALIETHIFNYLKKTEPRASEIKVIYAGGTALGGRRDQLRRIRGFSDSYLEGNLFAEHEFFKEYLKKERVKRNRLEKWRTTVKANKRVRLSRARSAAK